MRRIFSFFFCVTVFFANGFSQDFQHVDDKVKLYPKRFGSAEQLAAQIEKDFSDETDRVRAIYTWITHHISYDMEAYLKGETLINFSYSDREDYIRKKAAVEEHAAVNALRTGKAVCEGYAQLFRKVSELMGIPCKVVSGYSKTNVNDITNIPDEADHAWNAVRINHQWYLLDVTWGAGSANGNTWKQNFDDFFFFTDPDIFATSHYPSQKDWAFTTNLGSLEDFFKAPVFKKAYFENKLTLVSPKIGVLEVKSDTSIEFEIDVPKDNLEFHYAFQGQSHPTEIIPVCKDRKCKFGIPFEINQNTELTVFASKKPILQYKILLKN